MAWVGKASVGFANKVVQKSKEAKMKAAMAGGKSKKKKWAKGKAGLRKVAIPTGSGWIGPIGRPISNWSAM